MMRHSRANPGVARRRAEGGGRGDGWGAPAQGLEGNRGVPGNVRQVGDEMGRRTRSPGPAPAGRGEGLRLRVRRRARDLAARRPGTHGRRGCTRSFTPITGGATSRNSPGAMPDVFDAQRSRATAVGSLRPRARSCSWAWRLARSGAWDGPTVRDRSRRPIRRIPSTGVRASAEPAPCHPAVVQLDISRPDGWKVTVRVPDGGSRQSVGSAGHPGL